jgi:opacity protein-like surface antigen
MLICIYGSAQANTCEDWCGREACVDSPFYVEAFGGANFLQTDQRHGIKSDYQTGYLFSGSLAYRWCYGLRLEAEYAYRRNTLKKIHFFGRSFRTHGHFQSSSYMANLLWDLPLSSCGCDLWKIRPFIGAGIGYGLQQLSSHNSAFVFTKMKKKHVAWQLIAGLSYPLFCHTDISIEYKFHKGGFSHIYNHSVGLGLTYNFGF